MARARVRILVGVLVAALCCGCETDKDLQPVELEINLVLAANTIEPTAAPDRQTDAPARAFGDPGTTESFALPRYAYIYLVWNDGTNTHVEAFQEDVSNPASWTRESNKLVYNMPGDSVFVYNQKIVKMLGSNRVWGRLYVVMSKSDIAPYSKLDPSKKAKDFDEDDVKNLVFDVTEDLQDELQDIYSTPLAYEVNDVYYGTIANLAFNEGSGTGAKVAYANLLLYHVAAKVDLIWNVDSEIRSDMKLSFLEVYNNYNEKCYLFKPTENTVDARTFDKAGGERGYRDTIIASAIPGTQWQSRAYYYTIPYKNNEGKFPMQYRMCKNGESTALDGGKDYTLVIKKTLDGAASGVWTSWIRGQISITTAITHKTDTINK